MTKEVAREIYDIKTVIVIHDTAGQSLIGWTKVGWAEFASFLSSPTQVWFFVAEERVVRAC